ncbi:MAG: NUDIX domain-containing protein [Parcubacteria group bacterium]|nr:NUDIX domain-containing protein [Parcubacteria group bacterium]
MEFSDASFVLVRPDGKILLQKRDWKRGIWYPGRWVIPGGAREEGETPAECAVREIAEETGVRVSISDLQKLIDFPYSHRRKSYRDKVFLCFVGYVEIQSNEGQMHWKTLEEIKKLRLPANEDRIVSALEARLMGEP